MNLNTGSTTASVAIALAAVVFARDAMAWKKHGAENGVTVFTTEVEGSEVPRVKAVTTLDATTDVVWQNLSKVLGKTKGLKQMVKLGSCGENCEYLYQRVGHPLMKDRHWVVKMTWSSTGSDGSRTYRRKWIKTSEKNAIGSGAMPVEHVSGSWTLEPAGDGSRTRITYVNHVDLGGNVPTGLFSKVFVECSYSILGKLRSAY